MLKKPDYTYHLRECPLCSSEEITLNVGEHHFNDVMIRCEDCGLTTAPFDEGTEEENEDKAILHWNSRSTDHLVSKMADLLEKSMSPRHHFLDFEIKVR